MKPGNPLKDLDQMTVAEMRRELELRRAYDQKLQPHVERLEHEVINLRGQLKRLRLALKENS